MTGHRASAAALALGLLLVSGELVQANSRYSLRGNGESIQASRADTRALGGAEASSSVPSVTGNPASLASAEETVFCGTYETEWVRTEEPEEEGRSRVRKDYEGLLPNLSLVYRLPGKFALGTGILVGRRKGGRIEQPALTESGQAYRQVFDAKGNVLFFPALLARGFRAFAVGAGVDVTLLNSELRWRNDFPEVSGFEDSDDLDKTRLWGVAWKLGARVPLGSRLAVGGYYSLASHLDGSRRLEQNAAQGASEDLVVDLGGELADRFALGFEASLAPQLRLLGEWGHENWESVRPLSPVDEFENVDRFGAGLEWTPRAGIVSWPWRAGFRTEDLHVIDGRGRRVRETFFTAGSGFGLAEGRGLIDWYVEYGWRGERRDTEYYEQIVRVGVTLTGTEKWSSRVRPEEEEDW